LLLQPIVAITYREYNEAFEEPPKPRNEL
jgi:hypothetical protein